MFKKAIIIVSILSLIGCNAQKNTTMEKFDIEKFNKNSVNGKFVFKLTDDSIVEQYGNSKSGYVEIIRPKNNNFIEIYKSYFANGEIEIIGESFPNDFEKGIWKEFDMQGKLIKETDYDEGFNYVWEDLIKYLKERTVDIKGRYTTIRKEEGNWRFSYVEGIYIYDVIIDGKTGKIIQDEKNEFEEGS